MLIDSPLESQRFNVKAGKIKVSSPKDVTPIVVDAKGQGYQFLSCRVPTTDVFLFQELEKNGFFLTDTLIYYKRSTKDLKNESEWRSGIHEPNFADEISSVAEKAFEGYPSHYAMDLKLNQQAVGEIYKDWAKRSCLDRSMATDVLAKFEENKIISFVSLKSHKDYADVMLAAVHPKHQGKGLLQELLSASVNWAAKMGHKEIFYSTQIQNIAAQKSLVRQKWEPSHSFYTLHCWL
ncbi:MAG: GNAT family N-acetyltransferase [Bdellovibrio sp.]